MTEIYKKELDQTEFEIPHFDQTDFDMTEIVKKELDQAEFDKTEVDQTYFDQTEFDEKGKNKMKLRLFH